MSCQNLPSNHHFDQNQLHLENWMEGHTDLGGKVSQICNSPWRRKKVCWQPWRLQQFGTFQSKINKLCMKWEKERKEKKRERGGEGGKSGTIFWIYLTPLFPIRHPEEKNQYEWVAKQLTNLIDNTTILNDPLCSYKNNVHLFNNKSYSGIQY